MNVTKGASNALTLPPNKEKGKNTSTATSINLARKAEKQDRGKVYPIAMVIFDNYLDSVPDKKERAPTQHRSSESR